MKLKSPYNSLLAFSIILSVAFLSAWAILVYKSYAMKGDIAKISQAADDIAAKDANLLSQKTMLRDLKDDVALVDGMFLSKDGIPPFIDMLDSKAQAFGIKADIGSINLEEGDAEHLGTLKLHIKGQGSWQDSVKFISLLESLPYALQMDALSIARGEAKAGDKGSVWSWDTDMSVKVIRSNEN